MAMPVHIGYMFCQGHVCVHVWLIKQDKHQVETGEQRCRKIDILSRGSAGVVATKGRIGCGQDGCACIESCGDASFSNRYCLLLHYFVNGSSIRFLHLIEFVNAADS